MEDCSVGGYHIPAGTRLVINVWKIQRDPKTWSVPSEFRPERFLSNHANASTRDPHFEIIAFGAGRRSCVGEAFAYRVLHLMLARLLQGFELATPGDQQADLTKSPGLTEPKGRPLEILLTPRLRAELYV